MNRNGSNFSKVPTVKTPSPLTLTSESENEIEIDEQTAFPITEEHPEDELEIRRLSYDYITEEGTASSGNSSEESSPSTLKRRLHNLPAPNEALKLADRVAAFNRQVRRERDIYLHLQGLSNRIEEKDEVEIATTGSSTATSARENIARRKPKDARSRRRERMNLEVSQPDHRLSSSQGAPILKKVRGNCEEKLQNLQKFNRNLEELKESISKKGELISNVCRKDLPDDRDLTSMLDELEEADRTECLRQDSFDSSRRSSNENAIRDYRASDKDKRQQDTSIRFRAENVHDGTADTCFPPRKDAMTPIAPSNDDCSNFVSHLKTPLKFAGYRPSSSLFIRNLSSDSESDTTSQNTVRNALSSHEIEAVGFRDIDDVVDREVEFGPLANDGFQIDLNLMSVTSSPGPAKITEIQQQGSAGSRGKNEFIIVNNNDRLRIPTLRMESQELSQSISAGSREDSNKEPLDVNALISALSDVSLKQGHVAEDKAYEVSPVDFENRFLRSSGLKSAERTPGTNRSKQSLTPSKTRETCKSSPSSKSLQHRPTSLFRPIDSSLKSYSKIIVKDPEEQADKSNVMSPSRRSAEEDSFEDVPGYKSPITRIIEMNLIRSRRSSKVSTIDEPFLSPGTIERSEFSRDTSKPLTSRTDGSLSQSSRSSMSTRSFKSLSSSAKVCKKKKSNSRIKVEKFEGLQPLSRQNLKRLEISQESEKGSLFSVNHGEPSNHRSEKQSDALSKRSLESSTSKNSENTSRNSFSDKRSEEFSSRHVESSSLRTRSKKSLYRPKVPVETEAVIRERFLDNSAGSKIKVGNSCDESNTLVKISAHLDDLEEKSEIRVPITHVKVQKRKLEDDGTLNRTNEKATFSTILTNSHSCSEESVESSFKDRFIEATQNSVETVKANGKVEIEDVEEAFSGQFDLITNVDSNTSSRRPLTTKKNNEAALSCSSSSSSRGSIDNLRNTNNLQYVSISPRIDTHYQSQDLASRTHSFLTDDVHLSSRKEEIYYSEALLRQKALRHFTRNSRSPLIESNHLGTLKRPRSARDCRSLDLDSSRLEASIKLEQDFNGRVINVCNTQIVKNAGGTNLKNKNTSAPFSVRTFKDEESDRHVQDLNEGLENDNKNAEASQFEDCSKEVRHNSKESSVEEESRVDVDSNTEKESTPRTFTTCHFKNDYCSCKPSFLDVEMQSPRETCYTVKEEEKEAEEQTFFSPRIFLCSNCQAECKRGMYLCSLESMRLSNDCSRSRSVREDAENAVKIRSPLVKLKDDRSTNPLESEEVKKHDNLDVGVRVDPTKVIKSESAANILRRSLESSSVPAKTSASMSRLNLITETSRNSTMGIGRRSQDRFPFTISESASKKSFTFKAAANTMTDHRTEWSVLQEKSVLPDRTIMGNWNGLRRTMWDKFDVHPTVVQLASCSKDVRVSPEKVSCVSYGSRSEPRKLVPRVRGFVRKFSAKLKRSTSKSQRLRNELDTMRILYENPECRGTSRKGGSSDSRSGQSTELLSEESKVSSGKLLRSKRSHENVALTFKTAEENHNLENNRKRVHDDIWIQELDSEEEFDENVTVTSSPLTKERTLNSSPMSRKDRYSVFLAKGELRAKMTEPCRKSVVDESNERDVHPKKMKNVTNLDHPNPALRTSLNSVINERVEVTNDNDSNDSSMEAGCFCFKFCQFFTRLFGVSRFCTSVSKPRLRVKKKP